MTLEEENEMLRTSLKFYADPKNWIQLLWVSNGKGGFEQVYTDRAAVYHDGGIRARKTLEVLPQAIVAAPKEEKVEVKPLVVDEETEKIVTAVINDNPKVVEDWTDGKDAALNRLMGECMKMFKGRGDPQIIKHALKEKLPKQRPYTGGYETTFGGAVRKTYQHRGPGPLPDIRR